MTDVSLLQNLPTDVNSTKLLPTGWKHLTPLECYGDGNCLYRYVSTNMLFYKANHLHHVPTKHVQASSVFACAAMHAIDHKFVPQTTSLLFVGSNIACQLCYSGQ